MWILLTVTVVPLEPQGDKQSNGKKNQVRRVIYRITSEVKIQNHRARNKSQPSSRLREKRKVRPGILQWLSSNNRIPSGSIIQGFVLIN